MPINSFSVTSRAEGKGVEGSNDIRSPYELYSVFHNVIPIIGDARLLDVINHQVIVLPDLKCHHSLSRVTGCAMFWWYSMARWTTITASPLDFSRWMTWSFTWCDQMTLDDINLEAIDWYDDDSHHTRTCAHLLMATWFWLIVFVDGCCHHKPYLVTSCCDCARWWRWWQSIRIAPYWHVILLPGASWWP